MPNWCSNQIRIEGPKEEIDRIWNILEDDTIDDGLLTALAPLEGGWEYNLAIDNWGTKWDVKEHAISQEEYEYNGSIRGVLEGHFESAWGPPSDAVEKWLSKSEDYEADLLWYEPANDFCGALLSGDFNQYDVSALTEEFLTQDDVGEALDEAFGIMEDRAMWREEEEEEALQEPITLEDPETEV
tara:strand:+ start:4641 stop:5195 length:555 start_codon:yes stop_codon:yes gene_type:complete